MPVRLSSANLDQIEASVGRPGYDRAGLRPGILHVGVGNFHRAHMAVYLDRLFESGEGHEWAIRGACVRPTDGAMRDRLKAQDWLCTVVELDPKGLSARVTGSMIDFVEVDPQKTVAAMADPATRIVSLTITEGGYYVDATTGGFDASHPDIQHDAANPDNPRTVFGMIVAALRARRDGGQAPFTVMSCDNLPGNGHIAEQAVIGMARLVGGGMGDWIASNVAFPNGMVDCITPATTERERNLVAERFGIEDAAPVVCEPFRQWVLEDKFPQGRPALEKVGVEFVDDVVPYELMKLRILNAGHAAIAYPGALSGHRYAHEAAGDPLIADWLRALMRREVIPTLSTSSGLDYEAYLALIGERFTNPEVGDTVARLCLDGSNRQPKFVLPTIADALADGRPIEGLALEVALWCRYCAATAEPGSTLVLEDERAAALSKAALASREDPSAFLGISAVFGTLAADSRFADAFARHIAAIWADGHRAALERYLAQPA